MAYLSMLELEIKYNLTREQKAKLQDAVTKDKIIYKISQAPASELTGHTFPMSDTKVSLLKYDEEDVLRILKKP